MTADGWRVAIVFAVTGFYSGDNKELELLARLLAEQDLAKHELHRKGYGVTGTPWAELVAEVPPSPDAVA